MSRVLENGTHKITQGYHFYHKAVDLVKAPRNVEYITAHSTGKVVFCQTGQRNSPGSSGNKSYGNCVRIDHGNGFSTLYAHLDKVYVRYGETVRQGQRIGYMGNTGNSYGAHLHFEVRVNNIRINPIPFLDNDLPVIPTKTEYAVHCRQWLPWVKGYNLLNANGYAGITRRPIDGLKVKGHKYRVHLLGGKWLDWVSKVDDTAEGYAGVYGKPIDGIQIEGAEYRVHLARGKWLPWVKKTDSSAEGYAGIYGKAIDKIQIK